jgi:hypothetical protein
MPRPLTAADEQLPLAIPAAMLARPAGLALQEQLTLGPVDVVFESMVVGRRLQGACACQKCQAVMLAGHQRHLQQQWGVGCALCGHHHLLQGSELDSHVLCRMACSSCYEPYICLPPPPSPPLQVPRSFLAKDSAGLLQEVGWMKQPTAMHLAWAAQWMAYSARLRTRLAEPALVVPVFEDQPVLVAAGGAAATVEMPQGGCWACLPAWYLAACLACTAGHLP